MNFLSYGRQHIDDDDVAAVTAVLRSDFLTTGPTVEALEASVRNATGAAHAVVCSNGTAALHLAMMALGVGEGDVVVVPSMTFLASVNAARFVGAEVVFADVDPDSGLMTPDNLDAAIARSPKPPRASIVVHLCGQTTDLDELADVAARHRSELVEDACHALGTRHRYRNREGLAGDGHRSKAACLSFHPVKAVTTGEGGAITTNDARVAERLARFRSHGIVRDPKMFALKDIAFDTDGTANPWHYEMPEIGYNYRLSDINCALGVTQLAKAGRFAARRAELASHYDELLNPFAPILRPVARMPWCVPAWHLYSVMIDFPATGKSRAAVIRELRDQAIGSQVHYIPVHRQPYYAARYGVADLPGTDRYFSRQLSLPLFFDMTKADVERVVGALSGILGVR